jgi:Acetyltransferase (GNAT) family
LWICGQRKEALPTSSTTPAVAANGSGQMMCYQNRTSPSAIDRSKLPKVSKLPKASQMDLNSAGRAVKWRPAAAADLDDIEKIGDAIHAELLEKPEIFAEKLCLFPEGCFVLVQNEIIVGYGFSHPWLLNRIPALNEFLLRLPSTPDCILIHDVAVLQPVRGRGAAGALIELIAKLVPGIRNPRSEREMLTDSRISAFCIICSRINESG